MKNQSPTLRWTLGAPVLARDVMVEGKPARLLDPCVVLAGDFIYASHTYRQRGTGVRYITFVTAVGKERLKYQQSYVAERLEGPWRPEAATWDNPFAGLANLRLTDERWQGDLVHGEPLRSGNDEQMLLDRERTGFLFHGRLRGSGDSLGLLQP